jgi:hypothetical protein
LQDFGPRAAIEPCAPIRPGWSATGKGERYPGLQAV